MITVGTVCSSEKSVPCVYRVHTDNASQTSVGLASSDTSCFNIVQCKYFTNTCNWVLSIDCQATSRTLPATVTSCCAIAAAKQC